MITLNSTLGMIKHYGKELHKPQECKYREKFFKGFACKVEMMRIEKKTWPDFFQKILDGEKTFELRLADFECKIGDILVLREWDPEKKEYTGRQVEKKVTYVLKTKEIKFFPKEDIEKHGFQVIALK